MAHTSRDEFVPYVSQRKVRWRIFCRRFGISLGIVAFAAAFYLAAVGLVAGGWLPLPFRLIQAVLLCCSPPLLAAPLACGGILLSCCPQVAVGIDRVLPCGAAKWRWRKMRGRGLLNEEVGDNVCVGFHAAAFSLVLVGPIHCAWYPIPGAPYSTLVFALVCLLELVAMGWCLHRYYQFVDGRHQTCTPTPTAMKQEEKAMHACSQPLEVDPLGGSIPEFAMRGAEVGGVRRRLAPAPADPSTVSQQERDIEAATARTNASLHGVGDPTRSQSPVVYSTLRLILVSLGVYTALASVNLALYWSFGGEVRSFFVVLSELAWDDLRAALTYMSEGGDRAIVRPR